MSDKWNHAMIVHGVMVATPYITVWHMTNHPDYLVVLTQHKTDKSNKFTGLLLKNDGFYGTYSTAWRNLSQQLVDNLVDRWIPR